MIRNLETPSLRIVSFVSLEARLLRVNGPTSLAELEFLCRSVKFRT